uniref:Calcium uniporter protein n=2 Tax=Lygus hesperus TaxID=30085 RepID=A0A0A9XL87_LYGHE
MEYKRGLPQVRVPLPTADQECLFTLRPVSNTVGDFLDMIKKEDQAIGSVSVSTKEGVRIASSNAIEDLILEDFKLSINNKDFIVKAPERSEKIEDLERLSDLKMLVNQLYAALNVNEHVVRKERVLAECLAKLQIELEPLEKQKMELDARASRKTNVMTWMGLGLMSVQFGILARLTWWEYSWDIMEPVTYFVTYGTAMAGYAYYVLTKQEYVLPDVRDRQHLIDVHRRANKIGLNLEEYNRLKSKVTQVEMDLRRLRDPLNPFIPPPTYTSPIDPLSTSLSKLQRTKDGILAFINNFRKK